ncbi:conserved hypothetical protein [Candidatus Jettenia caeni]|uniref:Uncharacterized protein n=1 Tax=Candidatus Jettenia caeni TaxID=247490 RepID=I3IR85_9BACT|nr:hypothetical protein [Candidatus Jettenia sp. AMX1]WKZ15635.1 MAG: hypothetical protein QY317_17225 [Candidatus Jettenia caeni]GAB64230.1 conserved hypothetical protein [Candidatus Jettenia caeni]GJQ45213.1 MAG: hypothetical protein JETCAE04_09670 [Candidatus Jettenia caeni]
MEEKVEGKGRDKDNKNEEGTYKERRHNEGGKQREGYFISKRSLWLLGSGALGALAVVGFGKFSKKIRPVAVGAVKEGFTFSEWLATKYEKVKEDVEDIVAEAKHEYQKDAELTAHIAKKEEDILRRVEQKVEEVLRQKLKKEEV